MRSCCRSHFSAIPRFRCVWLFAALWLATHPTKAAEPVADDATKRFTTIVSPALVAKCVTCHRADNRKGDFDLTTREGMIAGGEGGAMLVVGKPEESPIYTRAIPHDGGAPEMPEKGEPLTPNEAVALRDWIRDGAPWPDNWVLKEKTKADTSFWSLQPIADITVPPIDDAPREWQLNPIDSFVFQKLKERSLRPSRPADARTYIRRATYDLHGLPPSPEDVAAFERECQQLSSRTDDALPDVAVASLIDRLLNNPHYGERWARHWLDIAHYADTHGFERDQLRPHAWRYRDYVIEAFNDDRPYDQFLQEQIAGDVIAPNDPKAVIATGFLAAGPWDFVGHVETQNAMLNRAARAGDLDDIVTQVMTATMGLTVNCARCHDHKLDPITQAEYYRLCAVFAGIKRGDRDVSAIEAQRLVAEKARLTAALATTAAELAQLNGDGLSLADLVSGGNGRGSGTKGRGIDLRSGKLIDEKLGFHEDIPTNRLQGLKNDADANKTNPFVKWVFVPDGKGTVLIDEQRSVTGVPATSGQFWDAIRSGSLNSQVSTTLAGVDYAAFGHSIFGLHANGGITFDLPALREQSQLNSLRLTGIVGFGAGPDVTETRADFTIFVDSDLRLQKLRMRKDETALIDVEIPVSAKTLTLIATDGGDGIGHDLLFLGDAQLRPDTRDLKLDEANQQRLTDLKNKANQLERELRELPAAQQVYATISETPPIVNVLLRGNPEDPIQTVLPGGPSCVSHAVAEFGDDSTPEGQRRRLLAQWITHPENPLTRRVLVNRLWHHHFGQGIVNTPSDFGYGGDRPSHPELLDWLAEEALNSGWSLKGLHRKIMMSATYRQASFSRLRESEVDASNRLLWRQNTKRLDAESLHDAVLSVTGKLNPEMGGPGFRDFNYTEAYAPVYEYVTPDKPELYRRSIYRFIVRTTPHQFMSTLDCADPANLTPARVTTTTAQQALALSNNEFMLLQSERFAERVMAETTNVDSQVQRAFELALQRAPTADEREASLRLVNQQSLFSLCRALFNANEFVYLD